MLHESIESVDWTPKLFFIFACDFFFEICSRLELAKALEKLQAMSQVDSPQHVGSGKNTRSVGTPASQQTPKRRPSGESGHSVPKPESPFRCEESIPEGETLLIQPDSMSNSFDLNPSQ